MGLEPALNMPSVCSEIRVIHSVAPDQAGVRAGFFVGHCPTIVFCGCVILAAVYDFSVITSAPWDMSASHKSGGASFIIDNRDEMIFTLLFLAWSRARTNGV